MPREPQSEPCAEPAQRPLATLPKAHLHLHLPAAMRRSAYERAFAEHLRQGGLREELLATLVEKGKTKPVPNKYNRRAAQLQGGSAYPPALPDTSDIRAWDAQMPAKDPNMPPGAPLQSSLIWDVQQFSQVLLENVPALKTQTVLHLAADAAAEGVLHVEVLHGIKSDPDKARPQWELLFTAREQALAQFPGVSLMYVVAVGGGCKTAADAQQLVELLRAVPGYTAAAIAGFGYYHGESKLEEHAEAFAALKATSGFRLVCIHAGEGKTAAGRGGPAEPDAVGPGRVVAAIEAGADRIGHGIEAAKDPAVMEQLKQVTADGTGTALEVCPMSNRALECWGQSLASHPLKVLVGAGVDCCLSADDPLYWAGPGDPAHGLLREYEACRQLMGMRCVTDCARQTVSFLS
jgi:hypothetical protein